MRVIFYDPRISRIDKILVEICPKFLDLYASIHGNFRSYWNSQEILDQFDLYRGHTKWLYIWAILSYLWWQDCLITGKSIFFSVLYLTYTRVNLYMRVYSVFIHFPLDIPKQDKLFKEALQFDKQIDWKAGILVYFSLKLETAVQTNGHETGNLQYSRFFAGQKIRQKYK